MMDTSMDKFYQDFDDMINKRRAEYTEQYGIGDYADLEEGYFGEGTYEGNFGIQLSNPGQLGIDTLVLGDILGQSSDDLTFLATGGMDNFDIKEILESTRENYAQLGQATAQGINEAAMAEDEGRRKTAEAMKREALKGQAKMGAATEESIVQQMRDPPQPSEPPRRSSSSRLTHSQVAPSLARSESRASPSQTPGPQ